MSNPNLDGWRIDDDPAINQWWFDRDRVWHVRVPLIHADGQRASLLMHVPDRMCDDWCYGMDAVFEDAPTIAALVEKYAAVFSDVVDREPASE